MNTTDVIITCFDEGDVVRMLAATTGVPFEQTSDGSLAGGPKVLIFESYGACVPSIGMPAIHALEAAFKAADFQFPTMAVMLINDDSTGYDSVTVRSAS